MCRSLACLRPRRRRYLDAMLASRDMRANSTDFARRVAEDDKSRLVRERFFLLKACMLGHDDTKAYPYLYHVV